MKVCWKTGNIAECSTLRVRQIVTLKRPEVDKLYSQEKHGSNTRRVTATREPIPTRSRSETASAPAQLSRQLQMQLSRKNNGTSEKSTYNILTLKSSRITCLPSYFFILKRAKVLQSVSLLRCGINIHTLIKIKRCSILRDKMLKRFISSKLEVSVIICRNVLQTDKLRHMQQNQNVENRYLILRQ